MNNVKTQICLNLNCEDKGESLPLTIKYFHFIKKIGKFDTTCKKCRNKKSIENHNQNKERDNKKALEYFNSEIGKNIQYKGKGYKIDGRNFTVEDYNILLEKQEGKCKICKKEKYLCIDHNHLTGEVRGLLCYSCNVKLDWWESLKDNIINYAIK